MSRLTEDDVIVSGVSDMRDLPLDAEDNVADDEYANIMRRTGIAEGEPSVSAFNSSI
jgi:hypothetical protein